MFSVIISVVLCVVGSHDSTIDCVHIIINGFLCSVLLLHNYVIVITRAQGMYGI